MDELLRTSLLWRLFAALAALYHRTFLPRMFAAIHRAFAESLPGRALRRLLGGQPAVERSAYRRLMDRGNAWLCGIGARVVPVLEDSLVYRIYRRVMAALCLHLQHGGHSVASVAVQLGVLGQQLLGVVGEIEGGVIGQSLDT